MASAQGGYYLPQPSHWPIVGSVGLFLTTGGFAASLATKDAISPTIISLGVPAMIVGFFVLAYMFYGWFGTVARESEAGKYNAQVDQTFRLGMGWFIFSEVMFFSAFFGTLYYLRVLALDFQGNPESVTHAWLYPEYKALWPTAGPGGLAHIKEMTATAKIGVDSFLSMGALGLPAINTVLLLTSSVTVTIAHHALRNGHRSQLNLWLLITVILAVIFMGVQSYEYYHAYHAMGLKLTTGAYGSTFFMLTGFHGLHVTVGATILFIIWLRCLKGHFKPDHHFGFEAAAWYWHFVDVVWLGLYIFVYLI